jgi:hypothetical protein
MKKNLLLILMCTVLAGTTQAQNRYLNISNNPAVGSRFVIPNSPSINVTEAQSKTITFRIMIPSGTSNNLNFAKIMLKNDTGSTGQGSYGITFGSGTAPHTDIRIVETSTTPVVYGNNSNTSLATSLNDGNWHHFALVLNDGTDLVGNPTSKSRLYFDGVLIATATQTTNNQTGPIDMSNTKDLVFATSSSGGSAVTGMAIDDIRVWDSAFTPARINEDKVASIDVTAPTTSGVLVDYDFESPATLTSVTDITGKTAAAVVTVNGSATAFVTGSSTPTLANKEFAKNALNAIIETNPIVDILKVSAPQATSAISVSVFDLSGKKVAASKSNDTNAKISLSHVPSGVYLVKITDGVSSCNQKIVKK